MAYVILRILLASVFLVSGGEKLLGHYQNFQYVIQGYQIVPTFLEEPTARIFPWIEFIVGLFLLLGIWTKLSLLAVKVMVVVFIFLLAQALIRNLPIKECGCFGELVSFPLSVTVCFDAVLLSTTLALCRRKEVLRFSLDEYFTRP